MVAAIDCVPETEDHSELTALFAPVDGPRGAHEVAARMPRPTPRPSPTSGRERVPLFPGELKTNGITTSFLNLLANLGLTARESWVLLPESTTSHPGPVFSATQDATTSSRRRGTFGPSSARRSGIA